MQNLLELSKKELQQPLKKARRKLIIILNCIFIILVITYLTFDKITTGSFVPDSKLYIVYAIPLFLNIVSLIYNVKYLQIEKYGIGRGDSLISVFIKHNYIKIDKVIGFISLCPILIMSFCHMIGVGNPSNDAILTDYALANSLIIGTLIIIGRKATIIWFLIVLTVLFWDVSRLGWGYEYHYLTPKEVQIYKNELLQNKPTAIERKLELEKHGLNPPKITRYFNAWFVFIIITFMTAYYFSGITVDMFKIVPKVVSNIEKAVKENEKTKVELEKKHSEIANSSLRLNKYNEIIASIYEEIEKLDYLDKKKLQRVINIIRKVVDDEQDWENFKLSFDASQSDFFKHLNEKFKDLTKQEMKHLAYIRMRQSNSEIAKLLNVKMETLRTLRYRLKKKLSLGEEEDLISFIEAM